MEYKNIIENGHLVQVKLFHENENVTESEVKVREWFENEKSKGYTFLKTFKEKGKVKTLFIKNEDLDKILCQK
jgi:hypothetical protein